MNTSTTGWSAGATVNAYRAEHAGPYREMGGPAAGAVLASAVADASGKATVDVAPRTPIALYGNRVAGGNLHTPGAPGWVLAVAPAS